jgi:hypothetical protein
MRGQVTVDFIVIWAMVLLLFSVLVGIYITKENDLRNFATELGGREVLEQFSRNANFVHLSGEGASASVWLRPSLTTGENYTLRVIGRRAELNWTYPGKNLDAPLYFSGFNGSAGTVVLSAGRLTNLTNRGGVVYVAQ